MIAAGIVSAEITFWAVLLLALACRYLLRLRRTSTALLLALPLVDLALLALVVTDLARGAAPASSHAFAAVYLGFTLAFGHPLVRWADARSAHRFRGAPLPQKPAKGSRAAVRQLWAEWLRVAAASAVAVVVLACLAALTGSAPLPPSVDAASTNPFWAQMAVLGVLTAVWFLAGPAFARVHRDQRGGAAVSAGQHR